jgi:hypothetical protein
MLPGMRKSVMLIAGIFFTIFVNAQIIYYADGSRPNNIGNGLSRATAEKDIQGAISIAGNASEIWVKEMCYRGLLCMPQGININITITQHLLQALSQEQQGVLHHLNAVFLKLYLYLSPFFT